MVRRSQLELLDYPAMSSSLQSPRPALVATTDFGLPSQEERERAVSEANECLEAMEEEGFQLDGFNLLSVVANPRSGGAPSTPSSVVARDHDGSDQQAANDAAASASDGLFSDAVHTFEDTLALVTEQIESLNLYLEDLSRQYLGGDQDESLFLEYYYQNEEDDETSPAAMMRQNVPPELQNLELQELQYYLEECGVLAHTLVAQALHTRTLVDADVVDEEKLNEQLEDIPSIFYTVDFDLTNAKTFAELLIRHGDEENGDTNKVEAKNSLYQPTQELVPVRGQDFLAGHLDRVELALQEQVRQKSTAFFQETTRFRQLQSSIEDLLQQVQQLRSSMQYALAVYRQTKDISDHKRQDYEILIDLLESSMELVRCKASIGGLLSANDHLGAAQQIQYGRKLLQGGLEEETADNANDNDDTAETGDNNDDDNDTGALELQNLTSLSTCGDQFTQYESLVVQHLSEELVEIFFHWSPNERERVRVTMEGLQICNAMNKTSELYQRRLQQMIRMTVRTTIAEFMESSSSNNNNNRATGGVTGMTYPAFYNCLQLLIEEIQSILSMAHRVDEFCETEHIFGETEEPRWTKEAVVLGSELATKMIAEILRLRREAHSVIALAEMKQLWDTCISFTTRMEGYSNETRAVSLRSTLVGQAKAFLDRTHESNMSALVAALDSERWSQCEVCYQRVLKKLKV